MLQSINHWFLIFEPILCLITLSVMLQRHLLKPYRWVALTLTTRLVSDCVLGLLLSSHLLSHSPKLSYDIYFYVYWASYALEAVLGFAVILSIYRLAMEPLPGLQALGMIMFRWAAAISMAIAITIGFGPHVTSAAFIVRVVSQLQEVQSVLTLCMLVFVCIAIRPMGLSYKSRIFGVSASLGLLATCDLVIAAWLPSAQQIDAYLDTFAGLAMCMTLVIWSIYFAMPEPERRMILLPTTSPFFVWNQISMALGDAPGYVAVGKVSTDLFAPAELEIMRRASVKMAKIEKLEGALAS